MGMSPVERLSMERIEFLEKVKLGIPPVHAAFDIGWSMSKLAKLMKDKDFREEFEDNVSYRDQAVVQVLYQKAISGHTESVKMWLENRLPDEWADKKRVEVQHSGGVAVGLIDATREGLRAFLADPETRSQAIAALAPGGVLDVEAEDDND